MSENAPIERGFSRNEPLPIFPFLVGRSRSGTTLLRAILDSHPDLAIPPEAHFLVPMARTRHRYEHDAGFDVDKFCIDLARHESFSWWQIDSAELASAMTPPPTSLPDALRRLYASYAARQSKSRYGDKTPDNAERLTLISGIFPEACFIHIVRDGRDVALSQIAHGFMPRLEHAAYFWDRTIRRAREASRSLGESRYREVRYEELVADPVATVSRLCDSLDLSFREEMLRYFERADEILYPKMRHDENVYRPPTMRLRDWRAQMAPGDVALFESIAGDSLEAAGYERASAGSRKAVWARLLLGLLRVHVWRGWSRGVGLARSVTAGFLDGRKLHGS